MPSLFLCVFFFFCSPPPSSSFFLLFFPDPLFLFYFFLLLSFRDSSAPGARDCVCCCCCFMTMDCMYAYTYLLLTSSLFIAHMLGHNDSYRLAQKRQGERGGIACIQLCILGGRLYTSWPFYFFFFFSSHTMGCTFAIFTWKFCFRNTM